MPGRDRHGQLRLDMGAPLGMEAEGPREGGAQPAGRHAEGSDIAPGQVENTVHFPPQARSAGASNSRAIFSETATPRRNRPIENGASGVGVAPSRIISESTAPTPGPSWKP